MIIRLLTENDNIAHEKIASQAWCFTTDFKDLTLPAQIIPGAFDEETGELMADMEVYDRRVSFNGTALSCAAIGGVASKPEYRRRGAIRAIMNEVGGALAEKNKWDIAILYPFNADYYRQFGYESAGDCLEINAPFSALRNIPFSTAELYEGKNLAEVLEFYNTFAHGCKLDFLREDGYYFPENPYGCGRYTYLWRDKNGKIRAYATFVCARDDSTVTVTELAYSCRASLEGILGFLRIYGGNYKNVIFCKLPADCPIVHLLADYEKLKIRSYSVGAVRIFNVQSVLEKTAYPEGKGSFTLKINDNIERSCGVYTVNYENGKADITKNDDGDADIVLDGNASVVLLRGVRGAKELSYINGAQIINADSDFFKVFTPSVCFFCDGF